MIVSPSRSSRPLGRVALPPTLVPMLLVAASVPPPVRCHSTVGPLPLSAPTEVTIATALLPRAKGVVICGAAWNRSSSWVAVSEPSRVARSASAVAACWSFRFSRM